MQPIFATERLILRPFVLGDSQEVQQLAGERDVAKTTLSIPHPYTDGVAESWIKIVQVGADRGQVYAFAVTDKANHRLMGTVSIRVDATHNRGEIAYWIGKQFWGHGYATEAAKRIISYGFLELGLNKIWAAAFSGNLASSNVMRKVQMKQEGLFREHLIKWGRAEDVVYYAILRSEYNENP